MAMVTMVAVVWRAGAGTGTWTGTGTGTRAGAGAGVRMVSARHSIY